MAGLAESHEATHEQIAELAGVVERQQRQLAALAKDLTGRASGENRSSGREVPYRYDPAPRWMDESGWAEDSAERLKLYPALRTILEKERWPGAPVRITYPQLAVITGTSRDTAKRRLKALEGMGVVRVRPGSGSVPTTVYVQHPIATPVPYAEVPYPAGGLAGAPDGYLEGLQGSKRAYAELYGADLPGPAPIPDQDGAPPIEDEGPVPAEEAAPSGGSPHTAQGEGAHCTPSETKTILSSVSIIGHDARARRANEQTDTRDADGPNSPPARQMEMDASEIPFGGLSEDAVADARGICVAIDRHDDDTAARAAQVAELLRRRDLSHLLPEVLCRIRRTVASGNRIHRPHTYLCAAILDAERQALDGDGHAIAARVLAGDDGETGRCGAEARKRGYEWLFEEDNQPEEQTRKPGKRRREDFRWWFRE